MEMESREADSSVEILGEFEHFSDFFFPVDLTWQNKTCAVFGLDLKSPASVVVERKPLTKWKKSAKDVKVEGDGNCLFRALSHWITGREENHLAVRKKIVEFMKDHLEEIAGIEELTAKQMAEKLNAMGMEGTWGTHMEILATATLLRTPIFIFSPYGKTKELSWNKFKSLFHYEGEPAESDRAIYLVNERYHYDPVVDVPMADTLVMLSKFKC